MTGETKWRDVPRGGKLLITEKGERRGGRKKGTPNKVPRALKESILMAAERLGEDGRGKGGLVGYMCCVAKNQPRAFVRLVCRILKTEKA